jgi:hypothetical protein
MDGGPVSGTYPNRLQSSATCRARLDGLCDIGIEHRLRRAKPAPRDMRLDIVQLLVVPGVRREFSIQSHCLMPVGPKPVYSPRVC